MFWGSVVGEWERIICLEVGEGEDSFILTILFPVKNVPFIIKYVPINIQTCYTYIAQPSSYPCNTSFKILPISSIFLISSLSLPSFPLLPHYSQSLWLLIVRPSISDRVMHKHCGLSAELSHITIIIMSNKATKCLLARSPLTSDLLLTATHSPFTYAHHTRLLDDNLQTLMMKYPHLSEQKVKDLLEELDNNCQLAMQILDEEEQRCRQIVEETSPIKKPTPTQAEQNRILKQSFLSLYKKLLAKTQELQQLQVKYEAQKSENGRLREMNRMLLQGEYAEDALHDLTPIC